MTHDSCCSRDRFVIGVILLAASSLFITSLFYIDQQLVQQKGAWGVVQFEEPEGRHSTAVQDFSFFWHTAHAWRTPPSISPYQSTKHIEEFQKWTGVDNPSLVMPYFYTPLHLYLFALTSLIPIRSAYLLWAILMILLSAVGVWKLTRERFKSSSAARWIPLIAFASLGYMQVIHIGQLSIFFLILLFGFVHLTAGDSPTRSAISGILLFLVAMKPPLALPIFIWTIAQKKYLAAGWFCACCLWLVISSLLLLGWGWISDYLSNISAFSSPLAGDLNTGGNGASSHTNLRNLINLTVAPLAVHASLISYVLWALSMIPLFLQKPSSSSPTYLLGYALMTYLIFSPHLNRSDDLLLALPLFIAGSSLRFGSFLAWGYLIAAVLLFFLPFAGLGSWMILITWACKAALAGWLLSLAFQTHPADRPTT